MSTKKKKKIKEIRRERTRRERIRKAKNRRESAKRRNIKWSGAVTKESDALDLDDGVFTWDDPAKIARSLKRSAMRSDRRKAEPLQSAMSMLNFYINRAGRNLSPERKQVLEQAKEELRILFGREKKGE